jgi:hypothetical protein
LTGSAVTEKHNNIERFAEIMKSIDDVLAKLSGPNANHAILYAAQQNSAAVEQEYKLRRAFDRIARGVDPQEKPIDTRGIAIQAYAHTRQQSLLWRRGQRHAYERITGRRRYY